MLRLLKKELKPIKRLLEEHDTRVKLEAQENKLQAFCAELQQGDISPEDKTIMADTFIDINDKRKTLKMPAASMPSEEARSAMKAGLVAYGAHIVEKSGQSLIASMQGRINAKTAIISNAPLTGSEQADLASAETRETSDARPASKPPAWLSNIVEFFSNIAKIFNSSKPKTSILPITPTISSAHPIQANKFAATPHTQTSAKPAAVAPASLRQSDPNSKGSSQNTM